jgi:hypothetical protein
MISKDIFLMDTLGEEAIRKLIKIQALVEENKNKAVTWPGVGSMQEVCNKLESVLAFLENREPRR